MEVLIPNFKVLSYKDADFNQPHTIERSDGELLALGDYVSNGTKMRGKIIKFTLGKQDLFVYTDWSNVGMKLDSVYKIIHLPSRFQVNDSVAVKFGKDFTIGKAKVIKVHFTENKVLYDLEVYFTELKDDIASTRIYNVDSLIVEPV